MSSGAEEYVAKLDPKTNRTYYYNAATKATTWKLPAGAKVKEGDEGGEKKGTTTKAAAETGKESKAGKEAQKSTPTQSSTQKEKKTEKAPAQEQATGAASSSKSTGDGKGNTDGATWQSRQDPKTGKTYYYNPSTRETRWTLPPAGGDKPQDQKAAASTAVQQEVSKKGNQEEPASKTTASTSEIKQSKAEEKDLNSDWAQRTDPQTQRVYYYNKKTRETRWERPEGWGDSADTAKAMAATTTTKATGPAAKEAMPATTTTTTQPQQAQSQQVAGGRTSTQPQPAAASGTAALAPLPPEWSIQEDKKTHKKYYYNKSTKETTWNRPVVAAPAPTTESRQMGFGKEWTKKVDAKTDIPYYYNATTGEVRWVDVETGQLTTQLKFSELTGETVYVICGVPEERACFLTTQPLPTLRFDGKKWVKVEDDVAFTLPEQLHSMHAARLDSEGVLIVGTSPRDYTSWAFLVALPGSHHVSRPEAEPFSGIAPTSMEPQRDPFPVTIPTGCSIVGVTGGVLLTGGYTDASLSSVTSRALLVETRFRNKVHELPDMLLPRAGHNIIVVDLSNATRYLWFAFAIGGFDGRAKTSSVERYVVGQPNWELMTPMSCARSGHAAVNIGRNVYVFGGRSGYSVLATGEYMHIQTDLWAPTRPMRQARCNFGIAVVENTFIFCVGGNDGMRWLGTVEAYDTRLDLWRDVDALPSPTRSLFTVVSMLPKPKRRQQGQQEAGGTSPSAMTSRRASLVVLPAAH